MAKVKDFEVDFQSGLLMCCWDDVQANNDEAKPGMILECSECGLEMILKVDGNGVLMWRLNKRK